MSELTDGERMVINIAKQGTSRLDVIVTSLANRLEAARAKIARLEKAGDRLARACELEHGDIGCLGCNIHTVLVAWAAAKSEEGDEK